MLRKLEKYELLEEIGHGGMATVFKARDERLDRMVAVKVLHNDFLGDDVTRKTLKYYFAFKRIKNFACVEIHPQSRTLLIYVKVDPETIEQEIPFLGVLMKRENDLESALAAHRRGRVN